MLKGNNRTRVKSFLMERSLRILGFVLETSALMGSMSTDDINRGLNDDMSFWNA